MNSTMRGITDQADVLAWVEKHATDIRFSRNSNPALDRVFIEYQGGGAGVNSGEASGRTLADAVRNAVKAQGRKSGK